MSERISISSSSSQPPIQDDHSTRESLSSSSSQPPIQDDHSTRESLSSSRGSSMGSLGGVTVSKANPESKSWLETTVDFFKSFFGMDSSQSSKEPFNFKQVAATIVLPEAGFTPEQNDFAVAVKSNLLNASEIAHNNPRNVSIQSLKTEIESLSQEASNAINKKDDEEFSNVLGKINTCLGKMEEQAAKAEKYQKNLQNFGKIPAESKQVAHEEVTSAAKYDFEISAASKQVAPREVTSKATAKDDFEISAASKQVAPREVTSKATAKDDFEVSYEHTFSSLLTKKEQEAAFDLFRTASKKLKESLRASDHQLTSDNVGVRYSARSQNVNYASALKQYNEALAGLDKVGLSFNSQTGEVSKKN
ncbi:MAG: hypothetical protein NT164_03195 [Verrucomicrobiae bacterium]|nr:hypothetical protein [Verrucomicrobiae bacterium]